MLTYSIYAQILKCIDYYNSKLERDNGAESVIRYNNPEDE